MPRDIYTVEIDGRQYDIEGDRPPTEAEARAAIASLTAPSKSIGGFLGNAVADIPEAIGSFVGGLKDTAKTAGTAMSALSGNPESMKTMGEMGRRIPGMAAGLWTKAKAAASDPKGTAQATLDYAYQHPVQTAMMVDPLIPGGGPVSRGLSIMGRGAGKLLRLGAPPVMDMGLQRTMAQRLEFPNTPQRLVDEGIIPFGDNIQRALKGAEDRVTLRSRIPMNATVDPQRIAHEAVSQATTEGKVTGLGNVPGPEAAEIDALKQGYLAQNTRARSLEETVAQKRAYAARARYDNRPNAPAVTNNELNFNKGVAAANRRAAIQIEPQIGEELAREEDLLGALVAQEQAAAKAMPLSTIGTAKTLLGLRNRTVMGAAAKVLDRSGRALQVSPAAVRAALLARLMASHPVTEP